MRVVARAGAPRCGFAAFVLLAAYLFHPFWEFPEGERTPHINACIMNTGLAGAFLMAFAISL